MQLSKRLENIRKRIVPALVSVLLVAGLSIPAFATSISVNDPTLPILLDGLLTPVSGGYEITVIASNFSTKDQEAWKKIMMDYFDSSRVLMFEFINCTNSSTYKHSLMISSYDKRSIGVRYVNNSLRYYSDETRYIGLRTSDYVVYDSCSGSSINYDSDIGLNSLNAANCAVWSPNYDIDSRTKIITDIDALIFQDDLDEEEPDPPSSSSIPEPSLPETDFPVIGPTDNEFVPYDTTVWNTFCDWVKNSIGSSTNVAFLILGVLIGIFIVRRIIKMFTG